jgi:hypothetical protein
MEEKVLLPEARRRRGGAPLPAAERLRAEHAALAALLVLPPTRELAAQVRAILAEHDQLEEGPGGIYEACEALAGADAPAWLERLRAIPDPPVSPARDGPRVRAQLERRLRERARLRGAKG